MRNAPAFLYAVDSLESEPLLWSGVARIVEELIVEKLTAGDARTDREETLRARLIMTLRARRAELPADLLQVLRREEHR